MVMLMVPPMYGDGDGAHNDAYQSGGFVFELLFCLQRAFKGFAQSTVDVAKLAERAAVLAKEASRSDDGAPAAAAEGLAEGT